MASTPQRRGGSRGTAGASRHGRRISAHASTKGRFQRNRRLPPSRRSPDSPSSLNEGAVPEEPPARQRPGGRGYDPASTKRRFQRNRRGNVIVRDALAMEGPQRRGGSRGTAGKRSGTALYPNWRSLNEGAVPEEPPGVASRPRPSPAPSLNEGAVPEEPPVGIVRHERELREVASTKGRFQRNRRLDRRPDGARRRAQPQRRGGSRGTAGFLAMGDPSPFDLPQRRGGSRGTAGGGMKGLVVISRPQRRGGSRGTAGTMSAGTAGRPWVPQRRGGSRGTAGRGFPCDSFTYLPPQRRGGSRGTAGRFASARSPR